MSGLALGIGTAIQAYGSLQQGAQKQQALIAQAANKRSQAAQVEVAANREIDLTQRRFEKVKSAQISAFGRSGVQISGSALEVLEDTAANAFDEIQSIRDAAAYRKQVLGTEAQYSDILADQAMEAGQLGALGSVVDAFAKNPYSYDKKVKDGGNL